MCGLLFMRLLSTMPCYMGEYCACKTITVFPGNSGTELSAHQGAVMCEPSPA